MSVYNINMEKHKAALQRSMVIANHLSGVGGGGGGGESKKDFSKVRLSDEQNVKVG